MIDKEQGKQAPPSPLFDFHEYENCQGISMTVSGEAWETFLAEPFVLADTDIQTFHDNGFVHLRGVFPRELLADYREPLARIITGESQHRLPMAERDEYSQAFIQIMNIWTRHEHIRSFILNRRTAQIATELLGTRGVRLWHDQALYKEAGGGRTPWHADQFYWPLSSDLNVTAWIPLQDTPVEHGALQFAARSHCADYGRHHAINDAGDKAISTTLEAAGVDVVAQDFALGDVSFHGGRTFHRAEPNPTASDRAVVTIIYIDEDMRVAKPTNPYQEHDQKTWAPGCAVGDTIASAINPVLYSETWE